MNKDVSEFLLDLSMLLLGLCLWAGALKLIQVVIWGL